MKKLPALLWTPEAHYHVHKISPLYPILSQWNPVQSY